MKITVKVHARAGTAPVAIVRDRLKQLRGDASVEEVFPGETTGRRAGLLIVDLPDDADSDEVLKHLRNDERIEYAERAASRKGR